MEPFWSTKFRGLPIRISLPDLSLQRMRQQKAWFGEPYGIPTEFIQLLLRGDMDAMACAVWIGQQKAAKENPGSVKVESPLDIDFTVDDFEVLEDPKPKRAKKPDPTPQEATTTDGSADTSPTTSEAGTSST